MVNKKEESKRYIGTKIILILVVLIAGISFLLLNHAAKWTCDEFITEEKYRIGTQHYGDDCKTKLDGIIVWVSDGFTKKGR